MSLIASIYYFDENGAADYLEGKDTDYAIDGEATRKSIWGSAVVHQLGLILLPQLARHDLHLDGDELDAVIAETQIVLQNAEAIANEKEPLYRLIAIAQDIAKAAEQAKSLNGGISLW